MTVQEAKAKFEELLNVPKELLIEYDSVANDEQKKALNDIYLAEQIAIECMEKQIPKKPIDNDGYYCPICNERVDDDGRGYEQPYCMECGQKIDWEPYKKEGAE